MLFITHNLPLVRSIAQRVLVMSQGVIVEEGDTGQVLTDPRDPYTRQLLADTPSLEAAASEAGLGGRLRTSPVTDAPARGPAPGHPDRHGGPADAVRPALPRQPGHPGAGAVLAGGIRGGVRRGLQRQPAVLTGPGVVPDRAAALAHRRVRQRGRVRLGHPHLRPLPSAGRLPHGAVREDALLSGRTSCTASRSGSPPTSTRRTTAGRRTGSATGSGPPGITTCPR